MSKRTIAVDIDDVIATHAPAFIEYTNKKWGTQLTVDDYQDHWSQVWGVDHDETEKRALEYHSSGHIATYAVVGDAYDVLKELKNRYKLVIITTRRTSINRLTKDWIEKYYPNIFDDIVFAGFFDSPTRESINMTKAELAREIRADYLIDDQIKHCTAAAKLGVKVILFGNYPWNQAEKLPENTVRVKDWQEVLEYFNAKG